VTTERDTKNSFAIRVVVIPSAEGASKLLQLSIGGLTYGETADVLINEANGRCRVIIHDQALNNILLVNKFSDLSPEIIKVSALPSFHLLENEPEISQGWGMYREDSGATYLLLTFFYDVESWRRLWSIREYDQAFRKILDLHNDDNVKWLTDDASGFDVALSVPNRTSLMFRVSDLNTSFQDEVHRHSAELNRLHELTIQSLTANLRSDSVVMHFDFPEEVRVPCEQYLLYFVQFLKDIGVEATAELEHQAGQVLFAVTPTDKDEALDNIRAALDTYLQLAASPVNVASVLSTEIEVQRLSANIQHLQGQLTLAHAVLQAKDATIQLQQTTIAQQRQMLTGEIVLESMKDVTPKPKDTEEVLGGLAEITKYEGKGFNLNLPEAFRRLRQLFIEKKGGRK
jgi:hypothetical protein